MNPFLYLIGTDHVYQFGAGAKFGRTVCKPSQEEAFRILLMDACENYGVAAIAEELNEQALLEVGKEVSVPRAVASSLRLPHRYCEPNRDERLQLGISDENTVTAFGQLSGKTNTEIEHLILVEWQKREQLWLEHVRELGAWPVLFICGSSHVPSFTELLRSETVACHVVASDWVA